MELHATSTCTTGSTPSRRTVSLCSIVQPRDAPASIAKGQPASCTVRRFLSICHPPLVPDMCCLLHRVYLGFTLSCSPALPVSRLPFIHPSLAGRRLIRGHPPVFFSTRETTAAVAASPLVTMATTDRPPASTASPAAIAAALDTIRGRIDAAVEAASPPPTAPVRLIAVSKTRPPEAIAAAFDAGQVDFGENYVQELVGKAGACPPGVRWHYIGALQSNKAKVLVGQVPGLACVQSVDRVKTARALNTAVVNRNDKAAAGGSGGDGDGKAKGEGKGAPSDGADGSDSDDGGAPVSDGRTLDVMVQVNTSGEDSKSGCAPDEAVTVARYVTDECASLRLVGLMTIGAPDTQSERPPAFEVLLRVRGEVEEALGLGGDGGPRLGLSMGMSGDYEAAVRCGATTVRVGSAIFGARDYSA